MTIQDVLAALRALEKAADDHLWGKHPNTQTVLIEAIMKARALLDEGAEK